MQDLIEAYNLMYQLDEVRFTTVGQPMSGGIFAPAITTPSPAAAPPPAPVLPPPAAAPAKATPTIAKVPVKPVPKLKTKAGTEYEVRTPTSAELKAAQDARKDGKSEEDVLKAAIAKGKEQPTTTTTSSTSPTTTTTSSTSQTPLTQVAQDAIDKLDKARTNSDIGNQFLKKIGRTMQQNSYDFGQMDQDQLTSLLSAYSDMYKVEEEVEEIQEEDPCWKGYTQVGMKMKGGREVPNCVPSKGVPKAKGYKKEETELEEGEVVDAYDLVLNHLMSEGFASDVESAEKMMLVMADTKIQEIVSSYLQ